MPASDNTESSAHRKFDVTCTKPLYKTLSLERSVQSFRDQTRHRSVHSNSLVVRVLSPTSRGRGRGAAVRLPAVRLLRISTLDISPSSIKSQTQSQRELPRSRRQTVLTVCRTPRTAPQSAQSAPTPYTLRKTYLVRRVVTSPLRSEPSAALVPLGPQRPKPLSSHPL